MNQTFRKTMWMLVRDKSVIIRCLHQIKWYIFCLYFNYVNFFCRRREITLLRFEISTWFFFVDSTNRNLLRLWDLERFNHRTNNMLSIFRRYFILRMSIVERNREMREEWSTEQTSRIFALFIVRIYWQQRAESCQKHRRWLLSELIEWLTRSWRRCKFKKNRM